MSYRVYGIPNCSTVKKARDWLETNQRDYTFHDYKKEGVTPETLKSWLKAVPLDTLLNRRGTTWRALDDASRDAAATEAGAIALMVEKPSLIKRPVVVGDQGVVAVGFTPETYAASL